MYGHAAGINKGEEEESGCFEKVNMAQTGAFYSF